MKFKNTLNESTNECICINDPNIKINLFDVIRNYIDKVDTNWNYILPPILFDYLSDKMKYEKLFLLDIRKTKDFEENGHIDGSINIFWKDLFKLTNLSKLPCPKTQSRYHNNFNMLCWTYSITNNGIIETN